MWVDGMKLGATFAAGSFWVAEGELLRTLVRVQLDNDLNPTFNYNDTNINRYKIALDDFKAIGAEIVESRAGH